MATTVLNGKPDAGNTRVRFFDEGDVAPAKPGRGSLFHIYGFGQNVVAVCAVALACGVKGQDSALWTNPDGGLWSVGANWTQTPGAGNPTFLTNNFAVPYTVTVDADASITNLTVKNTASGVTLAVDTTLSFLNAGVATLAEGATMEIRGGGEFRIDEEILTYRRLKSNVNLVDFDVRKGAEITVSAGGVLTMTNMAADVILGDTSGSVTSKITVAEGGRLLFRSHPSFNNWSRLKLYENGVLDIRGRAEFLGQFPSYSENFALNGGIMVLSGTGAFIERNAFGYFTRGVVLATDDALLETGSRTYISPGAGQTSEIIMTGRARLNMTADTLCIGDQAEGAARITIDSVTNHYLSGGLMVGVKKGYGELNILDGYVLASMYSTKIGAYENVALTDNSTGMVRVADNGVFVTSGDAIAWGNQPLTRGLAVGCGGEYLKETVDGATLYRSNGWYNGFLEVSGNGIVSNWYGPFVVGSGPRGYGKVTQTGGLIYNRRYNNYELLTIGCGGGTGEYSVSGGETLCESFAYVGGAPLPGAFRGGDMNALNYTSQPCLTNNLDATGTLSVSGTGVFRVTRSGVGALYVAAAGNGTMRVGSGGTIVADNIFLTNTHDRVSGAIIGHARVEFTPGADSVGLIETSGGFEIAEGAELAVDVSAVSPHTAKLLLVKCATRTGSFAEDNITITGGEAFSVVQDANDPCIYLKQFVGTSVIIR